MCFISEIGPIKSWLYAVRAFFILMILFGSVGCTFYAASFFLVEKTHLALISTGLIVAAGNVFNVKVEVIKVTYLVYWILKS